MNERQSILSTVSIYHALNDGAVSVIPILFPIFKTIFNLSYTQVGIITGGALLINLISQLLIGRYADGKNFRTMLTLGILLISLSMFLLTNVNGFITLGIFIFLLRFSSSFFHPIGIGWISRTFKKYRLDHAMGIQSGFADIGSFIAISTTLYITDIFSWDFPLLLWSLAGGIIVISGIFLTRNIDEKYLKVKKEIKKQNFNQAIDEAIRFLERIKLLIPAFMVTGASWGVIITYLPLLLSERTNLSLPIIGIIVSIWIGIGTISTFLYGRINDHIGRKNVLLISYLTIGISGIILAIISNIFIYLILMVLLGISVFLTFPTLASFVSENTDESVEGRTFGVVFTLQLGGGTILLFIGGALSDIIGIWIPFAIIGVLSLLVALILRVYYTSDYIKTYTK